MCALILILPVILPLLLPAQETDRWNVLDPFLKHMLRHEGITPDMFRANYFPEAIDSLFNGDLDDLIVHVVIHGPQNIIEQLNIHRNTIFQNFSTARVGLQKLHYVAGHSGPSLIEYGASMDVFLDTSRSEIDAVRVQDGDGLERSYKGNGVIVGIIDTGIDIFHPDFLFTDPDQGTRILSVWDTTLEPDNNESHPPGFDYGVQYTKEDIDATLTGETGNPVRTRDSNGHGTHVAGIAAGNGSKSDGVYTGIAPEADIVVVRVPASGISSSVVIDGMNYIFSLADDLGKPAAVNLSLGGHGGAHDGTTPQEKAITEFVQEPGRAVVVASGNSGGFDIHNGGILAPSDTASTSMTINNYTPTNTNYLINLLWYENLDDPGPGPIPAETMNLTITSPNGYSLSVGSGSNDTKDTDDGKIIIESYGKNEKDARLFYIEITDTDDSIPPESGTWDISLEHESGDGNVRYNMWNITSTFGNNVSFTPSTGREYTVTIPGTAEGAVTVGSYMSKNSWTDINGNTRSISGTIGEISSFSGGGPTRDGRLKPIITAPGQIIAAALSEDASFPSSRRTELPGYVLLEGTSMSTPHITGTVALLFDEDPSLHTYQLKDILTSIARSDDFTGALPNTTWGYGKVDVYDAVVSTGAIVSVDGVQEDIPSSYFLEQNYPNPFNPVTTIRYGIAEREHVTIRIYNLLGQLVAEPVNKEHEAGNYNLLFDASHLSSGVYFYTIEAGDFTKTMRATFIK